MSISYNEFHVIIDQSTSGTKLLLVTDSDSLSIIDRLDKKHRQFYPKKGWVEHDPIEIIDNIYSLFNEMLAKHQLIHEEIKSISITNQRETIVAWNRVTGEPIHHSMVWQCNRGKDICLELVADGKEELVKRKTGLRIDSYFSGSKIKWLAENSLMMNDLAKKQELAIGTMDAWIIWNLTQGQVFATEPSNACRTLLYDIHKNQWDEELTQLFEAPLSALPQVKRSRDNFGYYKGIPIVSVRADSQAALFGQNCVEVGDVKATLGTGCSVMMQVRENDNFNNDEIMTTIGWCDEKATFYALEGIIRSCGDTLTWLSDSLGLFDNFEEAEKLAFDLPDNGGVYLVPAQLGLAAPFWLVNATASFEGMSRSTTKANLIRAAFESVVYQIKAVLDSMERVANVTIDTLKVDGGLSKNKKLMQFLANVLMKKVEISEVEELSAMGTFLEKNTFVTQNISLFPKENEYHKSYQQWLAIIENQKNNFTKHV